MADFGVREAAIQVSNSTLLLEAYAAIIKQRDDIEQPEGVCPIGYNFKSTI